MNEDLTLGTAKPFRMGLRNSLQTKESEKEDGF